MGELAALQPGNVLKLTGRPDAMSVTLTVQGREFGKGELVAIGDEWAVMLTSLRTGEAGNE